MQRRRVARQAQQRVAHSGFLCERHRPAYLSADDDVALQTQQIDKFAEMGVDLLIVAPGQMKVSGAIERAYDKGIPVIVFDRRTHSNKYTAFIGADNEEMGRNMARYLSSQVKGNGRVLEICGLYTSSPSIARRRGFDMEAAQHNNLQIVEHIECDWTEQQAYRQMDSLLSAPHAAFNYVFAHNDRMAVGAKNAARKHGLDLNAIHFIGIDAMAHKGGGMPMVRDGELMASYIYPTRGDKVMKLAMDILEKRPYKRENLLSSALVTVENVNVLLNQEEELERQTDNLLSLRRRVETTTNAFDTQRSYLFMLLFLVTLLLAACALAIKAYMGKKRYNAQLKESMVKQRKLTDDMERMTQTQLHFFTNISHELRTPLTLIAGPADQLGENPTIVGEPRRLVEMIRRNVGILTQMVSEILEFRKIQNEKAQLTLNHFDLAHELRLWSDDFKAVAERRGIRLSVEAPTDACWVIADREKVAHIFFNLMTNALKYTPPKGNVTTRLCHDNDSYTISVADTGKGLSDNDRQHIFERFYQAADAVGGTGIGLAIVKAYVDLHHGQVGVESQQGKGSTFSFTIPDSQPGYDASQDKQAQVKADTLLADDYSVSDVAAEHNRALVTGTEDYDNDRPLLLIIDDNVSMRAYLRSILAPHYNVMEAQNGEEGLAVARKNVPQLVVCDVMMPVMDGLEFLPTAEGRLVDQPHPRGAAHGTHTRETARRGLRHGRRLVYHQAVCRRNATGACGQPAEEQGATAPYVHGNHHRAGGARGAQRKGPDICGTIAQNHQEPHSRRQLLGGRPGRGDGTEPRAALSQGEGAHGLHGGRPAAQGPSGPRQATARNHRQEHFGSGL